MRLLPTLAALLATTALPAFAQSFLPLDAKPTCAVTLEEFEGWIDLESDDLVILPPESFIGSFDSECAFYKWGAQMFLWLTSPADAGYIFDSTGFFDVAHDAPGSEKIAVVEVRPNGPDLPNIFGLRGDKPDFRGAAGQAGGGGVLLSQAGSLTYYGMHVNDAYVAFSNAFQADPALLNFTDNTNSQEFQFPSTLEDIERVVEVGLKTGVIADDIEAAATALAAGTLELKTSWVDAETVDAAEHILIQAQVPGFEREGDTLWPAAPEEFRDLAMVGMHIAGPVVGRPELVWISYEHLGNTPMGDYFYTTERDETALVRYDSAGSWIFTEDDAGWPGVMAPNGKITSDGDIGLDNGAAIEPQNIVQANPWGLGAGSLDDLTNNTDLISLNASLIELLAAMDDPGNPRGNYYQLGGIWSDGTLPMYQQYDVQRGGLNLANSTMESFHQFDMQLAEDNNFHPRNCFDCHNVSGPKGDPENNLGVSVSHIFQGMAPFTP